MSLFFYMFTFAINLWHRKFGTAYVTASFVNTQHCIQSRGQDFDKNIYIHSEYTVSYMRRGIKMVHLKCNLFAFSSIRAEHMQKI